jgi:hypothetical protein
MSFGDWNFFKYIFFNKNWLNDLRIICKSPSNLVEFLERDIDLEEKLKEFEGDFERDEVIEVWKLNNYIFNYILISCLQHYLWVLIF